MSAGGITREEVNAIYRRYAPMLGRRSRLLLRDVALADDALQELALVLLHRGASVRDAEVPYRWLCRTLDRVCFDLLRRTKRLRTSIPIDEADALGPAPGVDGELRRHVLASLEKLDEAEQTLAVLAFVDGCTQEEIGKETGVSRVTVNKRVQELRAKLRIALHVPSSDALFVRSPMEEEEGPS